MSDVVLLNLPIQRFFQKDTAIHNDFNPSLGLIYLATCLELNGRSASIIDLTYEKLSKEDFLLRIHYENPILIGISTYTENIEMSIAFSKILKTKFPDTKIVLGGPHVSLSQKEFYEGTEADFILLNEGEGSIVELVEAIFTNQELIAYSEIDGLIYKDKNEIIKNKERKYINDLDLLPIPKREFFSLLNYEGNMGINFSTSRGCPSKCIYCSATALSGAKYRVRDIHNVFLEMVMIENIVGPKNFFIVDDSFTIIKDRVETFTQLIKQYDGKFTWSCESLVNHMTDELLDKLASSNCNAVQYGIESGNQEVLKKINKKVDISYAKKIIKSTVEKGILPCVSFIIGHYCDTEETVKDTIDLIKELKSMYDIEIAAGFNTPFPGTIQYEKRDELGIELHTTNFKSYNLLTPIINTNAFNVEDQMNWMYEIKDIIYQKGNFFKEYRIKDK